MADERITDKGLPMPKATKARAKAKAKKKAKKVVKKKVVKKKVAKKKAVKTKTSKSSAKPRKVKAGKAAPTDADRFRELWQDAVDALKVAQGEAEKHLTEVMKRNRVHAREIRSGVKNVRKKFDKERRRVAKEIDAQVKGIEDRVSDERKAAKKALDDGVRNTLAALNIPSRKEIADLTRKVEALSKKIDALGTPRE